ncbi:hypothetical protein, partial [Schaalia canis]|uniref:hypothetical protein n=1 Tax=Schaalia canis TaxID=100469 RepID=UPI001401CDFD
YIAQYTNGARVVAVGIWPTDGFETDYVPSANREIDHCLSLPPKERMGNDSRDYVIERLEGYPDEVLAFQQVAWQAPGPDDLPISRDDYVNNPHVIAISTARAFGIFEDHFITVMIDDPSDQPPTEEELRALWDAQVAKMRY